VKKPVFALALMLAVPFGLTACGGDDKSDEEQVRDVISLANSQDEEVCDKLTDKYMKDVIGGDKSDCEKQVKQTPKDAVDIQRVTVRGDKATVTAKVQGDSGEIFLVKDGGDWKLDDIRRSSTR
jgi:hypothetical protein